jgi:uncharacterized protein (TIGR02246 family)
MPVNRSEISSWVDRYVRAWNSNDPGEIAGLFTEDAVYLTGPLDAPWTGRDQIVEEWLRIKDEPGTTSFTYDVIAVDGDLGVIQGRASYVEPLWNTATFGWCDSHRMVAAITSPSIG